MEGSLFSILLLSLLILFNIPDSHSFHRKMQPKCHKKEMYALLEYKASFYNWPCDNNDGADLKTWTAEGENEDCCNWDGVVCDEHSGHVIGLDLHSSCLSGSINSSSSIFRLGHLQRLDLSHNDFHHSKIPSAISNLSRLESLNLFESNFSGQIPSGILDLTNLSSLYLSYNQLSLKNPSLRDLVQALVKLEVLSLNSVDISSSVPDSFSRLTSLRYLYLTGCNLQGQIPPSIANLTSLVELDLSENSLEGEIPCLQNITNLEHLILRYNSLVGNAVSSFSNLTKLRWIELSNNQFKGEIFPHLLRLTKLELVDLSFNKFDGQIPGEISQLKNLTFLSLGSNNFSGEIHLDMLFQFDSLDTLDLSYNNFSFVTYSSIKPRSKLQYLALASCNLRSFPLLLQSQDSLQILDLSSNNISEIPIWICNLDSLQSLVLRNNSVIGIIPQCLIGVDGTKSMQLLDLSYNHLLGFESNFPLLKPTLYHLDLRFNQLNGSLPVPSTNSSIIYYLVSNNKFSGEIPTRICDLVSLKIFDLGNNNLNGMVPQCLTNLVDMGNLFVLNLHNNSFNGPIPQIGKTRCNLTMIDMSYNQLEGTMPRDIENCTNLEFLNLGNNKIVDMFPFWLGKLPSLNILILRSNRFHGIIQKPLGSYEFPQLQIIDLSNNDFIGHLSSQVLEGWRAMKVDADMGDLVKPYASYRNGVYFYTAKMINKGINMEYTRIPESLIGIDLSSNYFTGEIPKSITTLTGLHFVNLSNNMLTGSIPFNMNGLINLESLDLSRNKLSGEIPQRLTDLTTLSSFDVSFNQLTGPIPQTKQFNTFGNSSYQGNPGLCGLPLLRKCGNYIEAPPPPSLENDHESNTQIEINWKIVCTGYATGFAIGVVIGMNWKRGSNRVRRARHINFILN